MEFLKQENNRQDHADSPEGKPDEIEGLVLSLQDYRENDGILKLATPREIASIYARGVMKSTSKNRRLCNPFSKVRLIYEPRYSRDMYYLIHGEVLWYDYKISEDLLAQSICFLLRDVVIRTGINSFIYHCLEQCWHCWQDQEPQDALMYAALVMANALKLSGISPNLDSCVICGKSSGIETIVFSEGGFVCRDCRRAEWPKLPKEKLLAWRALFRAKADNIEYLQDHFTYSVTDLIDMGEFWQYHSGSRLASLSFLQTVSKL